VIFVMPDFQGRVVGRDRCTKSYQDFVDQGRVFDLKQSDPAIDVFGNSAVASYRFEISYEINGQLVEEAGRDLFVLVRDGETWKAIWRTLLPAPPEAEAIR